MQVQNKPMYTNRPAAVAGQFYPGEAETLRITVQELLRQASVGEHPPIAPKAIVAPHAGYIYSGELAARVYARLHSAAQSIERVVLLGPSHRVGFHGIACSSADSFTTPLGTIELDREALDSISQFPAVVTLDEAHAQEHSLEVQLPLLQSVLGSFRLVPLVVGQASADEVAGILEKLWGGPETLVVISTDLSHFHRYDEANAIDQNTARLIEDLQPKLSGEQACGCRGLNGLLLLLRKRQLPIHRVGICNSGDTAGDRARVVGYGAWVVEEGAREAS